MNETKKRKLEGLVIKDDYYSMKYINSKKADVIVVGFTKGNNRFAVKNWIGAIQVAVINNNLRKRFNNKVEMPPETASELLLKGDLKIVAKVSGMDDATRARISRNKKSFLGKVVEVEYKQFTGERLRDPRFKRFRDDKLIRRCTMSQFI